jgi:peptide/nickel transport system permease protein
VVERFDVRRVVSLGAVPMAVITRMMRSAMLEVLRQDYIRTARAKGLREDSIYLRHAFKNASIPVVTIMGAQMGTLLGGALISETIFSLPGVGRLFITSIASRDYPIIQAAVLFMILAVLLVNLVVDMLYAALDPRIRYS